MSPNSLFLGRTSDRISSGPFQSEKLFTEDPSKLHNRFLLVQAITNQFWKIWLKVYFPTLLLRQKWHTEKRDLKVGDVCLLKDPEAFRAEWRLARVTATFPDRHGKVRNVEVKVVPNADRSKTYKPVKPNYLKRHVSNLVVIVPVEDHDEKKTDETKVDAEDVHDVKENDVDEEIDD